MATELLGRLGIELDIARNGREAIAMAQAAPERYAAILMDMQMPELDGIGATRALRADPRFATIPIIAMTANAMKADLDACRAAGMNDHVTKPIDRQLLLAALRRWLPVHAAVPPPATPMSIGRPESAAPAVDAATAAAAGSAVEGVDLNGTVQRLGIERATLEQMLVRFADGLTPTLEALRGAVAAGDGTGAASHAHAIAGSAGNLGATALCTAAKTLEQAGRQGRTDISPLLADVDDRAAVVLRSVAALRAPEYVVAGTERRAVDRAVAGAAFERLTVALDNYDLSSASGALADLGASGLPAWAPDDLGRLRRSVDGYEYEEARGIASRLLARVRAADA